MRFDTPEAFSRSGVGTRGGLSGVGRRGVRLPLTHYSKKKSAFQDSAGGTGDDIYKGLVGGMTCLKSQFTSVLSHKAALSLHGVMTRSQRARFLPQRQEALFQNHFSCQSLSLYDRHTLCTVTWELIIWHSIHLTIWEDTECLQYY